jgi:CheY-like chemotaxis protein
MIRMAQAVIVEDDDVIRETLGMLLEEEGYSVVTYASGADAVAYLRQQNAPHLVLTDYLMPGMLGSEFLHQALEQWQLVQHRYIMLAARPRSLLPAAANAFLDRWHINYIQKPFDMDTLWAVINSRPN